VITLAQVNIRIDDALKEQGDKLFGSLGLNFSSAVSVFVSQAVREGGLPFSVTTKSGSFYSDSNMQVLDKAIKQAEERKFVTKTMDELLAMEK
jgi:DNA-damage-inducible protein J